MDQKIDAFLENLVLQAQEAPQFRAMPENQKSASAEKIRDFLNNIIIDEVIDRLTPEQLSVIEAIPAGSPQMEEKIEEYASTQPFLAEDLEEKLNQAVASIKANPQILN